MNIGHLVEYVTLLLLVLYWILTDIQVRTKVIWSVVYAASWALLFLSAGLHFVAQTILAAFFLYATFGPERI
jgi:hypothetical protein